MKFSVTIGQEGADTEKRVIEAESRFAVYEQIHKEGKTVIAIDEKGEGFDLTRLLNVSIGSGIKRRDIIMIARNLSAMLSAGLSLSRALSVIERQSRNQKLQRIMKDVADSIAKGSSLHDALLKHPDVFSVLFIAMVKSGEDSGGLPEALSNTALQIERVDELASKIKGAMIYPAIVISAVVAVGVLMMLFVMPNLIATFTNLGVQLPPITQFIVAVSEFMINNILLVGIAVVLAVFGGYAFFHSRLGGALGLRGALLLPTIGDLVRETYSARAARTLSSTLAAGVPVIEALDITKEVVGVALFASVLGEAEARVKKGESLSAAFLAHPNLYPALLSDMLTVGDETGKLSEMLRRAAEFYEEDVAQKTKDISTIIEPALMLIIGVAVGFFAVAVISPIYSLSSAF